LRARGRELAIPLAAAGLLALTGCGWHGGGGARSATAWPLANRDAASTRAAPAAGIDRSNVRDLRVLWRFRLRGRPGESGAFTATPVAAGGVVYVQDMASTVFALELRTGRVLWRRRFFYAESPGPNGLAVAAGRVFGVTDRMVFALSTRTGEVLWRRVLVRLGEPVIDVAPVAVNGTVYASTIGLPPNGHGALYALNASTGAVRWRFATIRNRWAVPREAGGGGAWYPPSVGGGEVFWGTANPTPFGGSRAHPNGGAYAGRALYTDSLLVLDAFTGRLRWYDQVTRHDVRDYDFQLSPVLAQGLVIGAGKAGLVIAWNRRTHRRVWQVRVGVHRNDTGPLAPRPVPVCPGLFGGVETPAAYADGTLFVPVVDLCMKGSAYGYESLAHVDPSRGRGELVALDAANGDRLWSRALTAPDFGCATAGDGVVFTSTFGGRVYAFDTRDGARLWSAQLRAGINACPALADGLLLVGAGVPRGHGSVLELVAFAPR
jgi:alcohol dehydrogenase (cytochrome c)